MTIWNVGNLEPYQTITALLSAQNIEPDDTIQLTSDITDRITNWPLADIGSSGHSVIVDFGGFTMNASAGWNGIYLNGGRNYLTFQNGKLIGSSGHGVFIDVDSADITGLTFNNLEITGFNYCGIRANALVGTYTGNNITIDGCEIHSNGWSGIDFYFGGEGAITAHHHTITIIDNDIHNNNQWGIRFQALSGSGDRSYGIVVGTSGHGNSVYNNLGAGIRFYGLTNTASNSCSYNTVYGNCSGAGQTVGGIWFGEVADMTCEYNLVYNNHTTDIDGVGIYPDVGCDGVTVRFNWVSDHTDNTHLTNPTKLNTLSAGIATTECTNIKIYGNVVIDNYIGLRIGNASSSNIEVYNNTMVNNSRAQIRTQWALPASCIFYNNIGYGGTYGFWESVNSSIVHDYNCFYGASVANYQDIVKGAHSLEVDPKFTNIGLEQFDLQSDSPCKNTGTNTPGAEFDDGIEAGSTWPYGVSLLDHDLYGTGWEMGAYVYSGFETSAIPTTVASTSPPTTEPPTSVAPTTIVVTTAAPTSVSPTTIPPTTEIPKIGTVCWGHDTGVVEDYAENFIPGWVGTGDASGVGDNEQIALQTSEFMISQPWQLGPCLFNSARLRQNMYDITGDDVTLKYRTAATEDGLDILGWTTYINPFQSLGWVQVRIEK